MTKIRSLLLLAGAGLAAAVPAQSKPETATPSKPSAEAAPSAGRSVSAWIEQLGAPEFRDRVAAERALRELGEKALPALREAAESSADGEVQWRARRLARQIERGDGTATGLSRRDAQVPGTTTKPEVQAPRDETPPPAAKSPEAPGEVPTEPLDPSDPFAEMERRFAEMERRMDEMFGGMERELGVPFQRRGAAGDDLFRNLRQQMQRARTQAGPNGFGGSSSSQGMSMQIGPDGAVKVEVQTRNEAGEVETKTYEAPSMEEFQKQYPGVLQGQGLGGSPGMSFGFGPRGQLRGAPSAPRTRLWQDLPTPQVEIPDAPDAAVAEDVRAAMARGDVLGVQIRPEIGAELREHLGLTDGRGLMVEAVEADSLGAKLGIERADIVVSVAGKPVAMPADVKAALQSVGAGGAVEVQVLRKGRELTLRAQKPAAVDAEPQAKKLRGRLRGDSGGSEIR
ncbi:MAG: hypothetical protein RL398_29 [Planctomycetota bacterium]